MWTYAESTKLVLHIDKLEKHKKQLEEKLRAERESNFSAAQTYGSKLCTGDILHRERHIDSQIKETVADIALYKDALDGKFDIASAQLIEEGIKIIDQTMQTLQVAKALRVDALAQIAKIKAILES